MHCFIFRFNSCFQFHCYVTHEERKKNILLISFFLYNYINIFSTKLNFHTVFYFCFISKTWCRSTKEKNKLFFIVIVFPWHMPYFLVRKSIFALQINVFCLNKPLFCNHLVSSITMKTICFRKEAVFNKFV